MSDLFVGEHRAHLFEQGEGPPVVLLHSGGLSGTQWRRLIERLVSSYRVLAPDFLGMGESAPWPRAEAFHFSMDVDLAQQVIERAGAPVHLVGHSYGGLIALQAAKRAPARVRSLVLCEPVAFGALPPSDPGRADLDRSGAETADEVGGTEPWLRGFIDYWNGPGSWDRLPAAQRESFLRVGRKLYLEVRSLAADTTAASEYQAVACPTLLISGTRSTVAAQRVAAILAEALPRARHVALEGATHMAPLSDAKRVNELIAEHLASA